MVAVLLRVIRSKAAGGWRHWLTPADVELLRRLLAADLKVLGYADDRTLADPQTLDPRTGSDYVAGLRGDRLVRLRRTLRWLALRTLRPLLGQRR